MFEMVIKQIIDGLSHNPSYRIIELSGAKGLASPWGLLSVSNDEAKIITFCSLKAVPGREEMLFGEHLYGIEVPQSQKLVRVLIIPSGVDCREYILQYKNSCSAEDRWIVIDGDTRKIIYYEEEQELAQQMQYILNVSSRPRRARRNAVVTYSLIAVNILMYIVTSYLSSNFIDSDTGILVMLGAKYNPLIAQGEYYRLITCMFLHGGLMHVAFNMYALYAIGPLAEEMYGKLKYISIYFGAGILSSLFSYLFVQDVSVGASGAIFGLLGAILVYGFFAKEKLGRGFIRNILSVIVINLILGFSFPNIDNFGHLGGLIGGIILAYIFSLYNKYKNGAVA